MNRTTPGRRAPLRPRGHSAPPPRRDPRGPGAAANAALRRRELERLPRYWFANRLLLTLSGQKPVHWMLGHTLGTAYDQLIALAPLTPLRPAPGGVRTPAPAVRRCDEFRPGPGVIEAFARIESGDRLHALAFRLERGRDARWRCSAVDIGAALQVDA